MNKGIGLKGKEKPFANSAAAFIHLKLLEKAQNKIVPCTDGGNQPGKHYIGLNWEGVDFYILSPKLLKGSPDNASVSAEGRIL